jgi:hypothetical protein
MSWLLWFAIGYCVSTIFPVPKVQRVILDGWARVWDRIKVHFG